MPVHWPDDLRSGAEVPIGTFVEPPGQHTTYAGASASLTVG